MKVGVSTRSTLRTSNTQCKIYLKTRYFLYRFNYNGGSPHIRAVDENGTQIAIGNLISTRHLDMRHMCVCEVELGSVTANKYIQIETSVRYVGVIGPA
jgi:hypothetical protein